MSEANSIKKPRRYLRKIKPMPERFWAKVDKTSNPEGCWPWLGKLGRGYGDFQRGRREDGHCAPCRVAYELYVGLIPNGMEVCHSCDNPPCCNPAHLFLGTHQDNQADKVSKGRQMRGEKQPFAKLNASKVAEIRHLRASGSTEIQLAEQFNVCRATIGYVVRRGTWKHIP